MKTIFDDRMKKLEADITANDREKNQIMRAVLNFKIAKDAVCDVMEPSIATAIEPFLQTYENGTMEQLDGQMAGMKIPLARLSSPEIYYILTGNELNLHLNDPRAPKILCLGGNANRMEAITPVLSLYIDRVNQLCTQPKQYPCALVCDEFATGRAASILNTMATGRGNDIIPIIAV
jgi:hypothetical protein